MRPIGLNDSTYWFEAFGLLGWTKRPIGLDESTYWVAEERWCAPAQVLVRTRAGFGAQQSKLWCAPKVETVRINLSISPMRKEVPSAILAHFSLITSKIAIYSYLSES